MTRILPIQPLTRAAFAPFGDVIEADPASMRLINSGTTERYHGLGKVEARGEGAEVILNIFRGQPRSFPYEVGMMERHPFGSQSFQPLDGRRYLGVVAADDHGRPEKPLVFLASGNQGVNYRANIWHHPLMALDTVSNFLVVDRDGPGHNLEEYFYSLPFIIERVLK